MDLLETTHRDLGPYVHVDIREPEQLAAAWGNQPKEARWLVNPIVAAAARCAYQTKTYDSDEDDDPVAKLDVPQDVSNGFGVRLAECPPEISGKNSRSTFVRFLSEDGRVISRRGTQGLPQLPWSFGSDVRNTVVVDVHDEGVAPFHCVFAKSFIQPARVCVVPLAESAAATYVVSPKYQPLQVRNGDRLVCLQWVFELRLRLVGPHTTALSILTDEGVVFEAPMDGCHIGAACPSRQMRHQPSFPPTKLTLDHRSQDMPGVHVALHYEPPMDRWTLVDHSPDPMGTLLLLKTGVAYPLSRGLRVKMGTLTLEVIDDMCCS